MLLLQGWCSPTALFFMFVGATFIFAAVIHPQEFFNLIHGFLYFLLIPTMYLLLNIYSITNLNVVSWGTREVVVTQTQKDEQVIYNVYIVLNYSEVSCYNIYNWTRSRCLMVTHATFTNHRQRRNSWKPTKIWPLTKNRQVSWQTWLTCFRLPKTRNRKGLISPVAVYAGVLLYSPVDVCAWTLSIVTIIISMSWTIFPSNPGSLTIMLHCIHIHGRVE